MEKPHPKPAKKLRSRCRRITADGKRVRRAEAGTGQAAEGSGEGELAVEAVGGGVVARETGAEGRGLGKLLSPERRHRDNIGIKSWTINCSSTLAHLHVPSCQRLTAL